MAYGYNRQRSAPPRPVLGLEHELDPWIEKCLSNKQGVASLKSKGSQLSREIFCFQDDPQRIQIPAPKACMIANLQFAVPLDNPRYPEIRKLDTAFDDTFYYAVYAEPIPHAKNPNYRHIPGYTRYVINAAGHIHNAHNGMAVKPLDQWNNYELVGDKAQNKLSYKISIKSLMMLAFSTLPETFIDYGYGNYSHKEGISTDGKNTTFVPNQAIKVKDPNGQVHQFPDIFNFVNTQIGDWEAKGEWRPDTYKPLERPIQRHGWIVAPVDQPFDQPDNFLEEASTAPEGDTPAAAPTAAPVEVVKAEDASPAPVAPPATPDFDDDIVF